MPSFPKIKFKKNQYNVASKSVFVLTVELLDSSVLECTLSADSTGRDCMDNICTRLGLQQPDLFGLRYLSRKVYPKIRWVDLDRPLKRQLEKYAKEAYLYLGVVFYVTDVSLLEDEVTRYHYFLQLKMDVVEGRLRCNYEQAIVLASYSLQAEFGDHDPEKHTAEYLKDFPLLPKPMVSQFEDRLGALTDAVISQHASLIGTSQQLAEIYYIVGAQQLEGYGQECFLAKDDSGNEVLIGASLTGICVRKGSGQAPLFFCWRDITNLVNHKKYFGIECQNYDQSTQYVFNESEAAKYVWKMCVLQHTFFKMHQNAAEGNENHMLVKPPHNQMSSSLPPNHHLHDDFHHLTSQGPAIIKPADIQHFQKISQNIPMSIEKRAANSSVVGLAHRAQRIVNKPLNQTVNNTVVGNASTSLPMKQSIRTNSNTSLNDMHNSFAGGVSGGNVTNTIPGSGPYLSGARSTTDLDRMAYNPPPDYHTALQNNYPGFQHNRINSSHPEIWHASQAQHGLAATTTTLPHGVHQQHWQQYNLHPSRSDIRLIHGSQHNIIQDDIVYPLTNNHTYSTPDLNKLGIIDTADSSQYTVYKMGHQFHELSAAHNNNNNTRIAVPGSMVNMMSTSTPDLAMKGNVSELQLNLHNLTVPAVHQDQFVRYSDYTVQQGGKVVVEVPGQHQVVPGQDEQQEPIYQNQVAYYHNQTEDENGEPIYQNLPAHQNQGGTDMEQQDEGTDEHSGDILEEEEAEAEEMTEVQHYDDSVQGLTQGIKIDDSPRKDNSANATLEEEMIHRKENGGSLVTKFSAKKGFTLSHENLANVSSNSFTSQQRTTDFGMIMKVPPALGSSSSQQLDPDTFSSRQQPDQNQLNDSLRINDKLLQPPQISAVETLNSSNHSRSKSRNNSSVDIPNHQHLSSSSSIKSKMGQLQSNLSLLNLNLSGGGGILSKKKSLGSRSSHSSSDTTSRKGSSISRSRPDLTNEMEIKDPTKIPKESIGAYLESKLLEGEVMREFETIPKKKVTGCNTSVAELPENLERNRFPNVLPYNDNRVKINNERENKYGYVNASHISATVGNQQRFYIAAQSPMPNTVHNFWSMVLLYDVHLIIMLTELSGSTKGSGCTPYCPQSDGSSIEIGDYTITKKFSSESGSFVTTTLQLLDKASRRKRQVWHIQCTDWNENGTPKSVSAYLQFLEELAAVRRVAATEIPAGNNKNPPVLVHCSAGVGRTGVTILSDILLYCLDHNIDINIPKILTHLRQQRMLMVQTVAQYKFVHETLIGYLRQSRLI